MGKLQITVIAVLAGLSVSPLWGADLPTKAPSRAPIYADPFEGFYAGVDAGWGWNTGGGQAGFSELPLTGINASVPQGVVGGGHLGYGTRFGGLFYVGLEGFGLLSAINAGGNGLITLDSKNDWIAGGRARVGIVFLNDLMLYGTGGWGWSGGKLTLNTPVGSMETSPTISGFNWGLGIEHPIAPNWLIRAEYQRYDFGSMTLAGPSFMFNVDQRVQTLTLGLSYKF
jgi:outer membrane immunogenic protein